jgi:hypothetical protein
VRQVVGTDEKWAGKQLAAAPAQEEKFKSAQSSFALSEVQETPFRTAVAK